MTASMASLLCVLMSASGMAASHHLLLGDTYQANNSQCTRTSKIIIPFRYDPVSAPVLIVQVCINGNPSEPFAVDTGEADTAIIVDTQAAHRLELPVGAAVNIDIAQGVTHGYFSVTRQIQILGENQKLITVSAAPNHQPSAPYPTCALFDLSNFPDIKTYDGGRIAGIIGAAFLKRIGKIVQIDFVRKEMIFLIALRRPHKPAVSQFHSGVWPMVPIRLALT